MLRTTALTSIRGSKHKLTVLVVLFVRQWQQKVLYAFLLPGQARSMLIVSAIGLPVNRRRAKHMQDLWGEKAPQPQPTQRTTKPRTSILVSTAQDCYFYGHTWTAAGLSGEKLCIVCGVKGYCPGCMPLPSSKDARPFLCTKHNQGRVSA